MCGKCLLNNVKNILTIVTMINFCSSFLNPTISTSSVSSDGYEVTNLISNDYDKHQKGFLAYHAIKPPVTITIDFVSNVNISHLILWPQVGSQKSIGFEILASSSSDFTGTEIEQQYQKISYGYLKGNDQGIIFYRQIYKSKYLQLTSHLNNFTRNMFFSSAYSLLNDLKSIKIKIIKTLSSVPALARVEVWGQPGKSCDHKIRHNVLQLWKNRAMKVTTSHSSKEYESQNELKTVPKQESLLDIPEEFLDSITNNVMALPMVLPSGKVVDQSTLEKHKACEANWGRVPSDPFTGKIFTEFYKPVPASALKVRIDKFLLENSEKQELWTVPRTVGKMVKNDINSEILNKDCISFYHDGPSDILPSCSKSVSKRPVNINEDVVRRKMLKLHQDEVNKVEVKKCIGDSSSAHEDEDWSLNCALQATLAGLPKYTAFSGPVAEVKTHCCKCSSVESLFSLPCSHFVCRNCLVLKKQYGELRCCTCKRDFKSSDPIRHHI